MDIDDSMVYRSCVNCLSCKMHNERSAIDSSKWIYGIVCKQGHWSQGNGKQRIIWLAESDLQRKGGEVVGIYPADRRTFRISERCPDYEHHPIGGDV